MSTFCLQCALKALLDGEPTPTFPSSAADHLQQYHHDPCQALSERMELERRFRVRVAETVAALDRQG